MGIFNWFKKPIVVQDEFFGKLRYMDSKNFAERYFEGEGVFSATNIKIGYLIDADVSGPTIAQRDFYVHLQNNYEQYVEKIKPVMEESLQDWLPNGKIIDFNNEFTLESITIPRLDIKPVLWEMAFTMNFIWGSHENYWFTLKFEDDLPIGVFIDG